MDCLSLDQAGATATVDKKEGFMERRNTSLIVVLLIALTAVFVLYMSGGSSSTAVPSFAEQQKEVARLQKQITFLEQRVNLLYDRQTEPRRHKEELP